jgi:hypothetical protein
MPKHLKGNLRVKENYLCTETTGCCVESDSRSKKVRLFYLRSSQTGTLEISN